MDNVTFEQEIIPKKLAEREDFLIGRWYAIKDTCVQVKHLPRWHQKAPKCKDPLTHHTKWVLKMEKSENEYMKIGSWESKVIPLHFDFNWDEENQTYQVVDNALGLEANLAHKRLKNPRFRIRKWYHRTLSRYLWYACNMWDLQGDELPHLFGYNTTEKKVEPAEEYEEFLDDFVELYVAGLEDQEGPILAVHQHAAATKDPSWVVPNPVVVVVNIKGQPA